MKKAKESLKQTERSEKVSNPEIKELEKKIATKVREIVKNTDPPQHGTLYYTAKLDSKNVNIYIGAEELTYECYYYGYDNASPHITIPLKGNKPLSYEDIEQANEEKKKLINNILESLPE